MVAPVIAAAAISAASSALGGILGASAQKKALKLQAQEAARQNLISQKQLELSERMIDLGLATQIDARGNITYFDEPTNTWKTVLSDGQAQLADASDAEQIRALSVDASLARGELLRNSARRAQESGVADGMLKDVTDQASGKSGYDPKYIGALISQARTKAVNAGFDGVSNAISTQALRSGANGAGAASQLAKARAQAIAQTMGVPELEGIQSAEDLNATRMGNRINNYSAIASRAANSDGYSYTPSNVAPTLNASLQAARQNAQNGVGQGANSLANAGRPNAVPGVYNPAPLIGSLSNVGTSLFDALMSRQSATPTWQGDPSGRAVTGDDWKTTIKGAW